MKDNNEIKDFVDSKVESKEYKKFNIKEWFDGSVITKESTTKQLPFILYISFLAVLYIGNRYQAERIVRNINKIQQEVKDLRTQSIITASELIIVSRQSEVIKLIEKQGLELKESKVPPIKIKK